MQIKMVSLIDVKTLFFNKNASVMFFILGVNVSYTLCETIISLLLYC